MEDLSLHILDIAENSIDAGASLVRIRIEEETKGDRLSITISDNGRGINSERLKMVTDPFFTTKTVRRIGLGLPLLKQAAEECGGLFSISSEEGQGTTISASFMRSHIDRKPLGDLASTLTTLIAGNPEVDYILEYSRDNYNYRLDTSWVRKELGGLPLNTPKVLELIREEIKAGTSP